MLLQETDLFILRRHSELLLARLKRPHRVLSTCTLNGGLREDLTHVAMRQAGAASVDAVHSTPGVPLGAGADRARTCRALGLPSETTALLGTVAGTGLAELARAGHAELGVTVVAATALPGRWIRAGDPARRHEHPDGSGSISPRPAGPGTGPGVEIPPPGPGGTVLMAFVDRPCTAACLVRAATLITEGKSTALLDRRLPSLQAPGLATGAGMDELAIAAPLATEGDWERHWAGSHNSLGELLGRATHDALSGCLQRQTAPDSEPGRSICGALGRHGCDEGVLRACADIELEPGQRRRFGRELAVLVQDSQGVAAAFALAEVMDLARSGILHPEVAREAILNQAALLAAGLAARPDDFGLLRDRLASRHDLAPGRLAALAVIAGCAHRWS